MLTQKRPVGKAFPLAGFFYTGPERDTIFPQFQRGNDQAPIVALAQLVERNRRSGLCAEWSVRRSI